MAAYEYESELEDELEDELEGESGLEGEGWLGALGNIASSLLGEGEGEEEQENEFEAEISPIRKIYPDAMMEHLGELAAEAETEDEAAEHFLPLIGMAASKLLPVVARAAGPLMKRALPKIARAVTKASPNLTRNIGKVAKTLHRNPATRHLLKAVPAIARRTVGSIARQVAHGRPITPRVAVRTLAKQARHVLGHRKHRRHALRRHNRLERQFHRQHGPGVRPHWRYGRHPQGSPQGQMPGGTPPVYTAPGGAPGARYGHVAGGSACPACGTTPAQPAPTYCHCCGQVLR